MSRYTCDDCGSIFYDPDTKEMYNELHNCCPMCDSVNIHKDWSYIERQEALEKTINDIELIKERLTDIEVKIRKRLNDLNAELKFDDIVDDIAKRQNDLQNLKDYLRGYEE